MHQLVLRKSLTLELPHVEKIHLAYFRSAVVKTLCKYAKSIIKHVHCINMGIGCNKNDNNKINKSGSRFERQLLVVNKNP